MQEQPVSRWPFAISINAAVAILSTACTAAMMHNVSAFIGQLKWLYLKAGPRRLYSVQSFDEASRGPYGSILFLFKVSWNMATLGALITILRLGFAPLTQEVISLQPRPVYVPDQDAYFGFAHTYDRDGRVGHNGETPPDPQMQSAMIKGIYDIQTAPIFNCSGTCLWNGSYMSLGFTNVCKNVTVSTLKTISCTNATGHSVSTSSSGPPQEGLVKCNMTTPGGIILSTQQRFPYLLTMFRSNTTVIDSGNGSSPDIMSIAIYRTARDDAYRPSEIDITECTVSYAAYEYTNARANGSVFSFESIKTMDLEWALTDNENNKGDSRRLLSIDPKDNIPEMYSYWLDERALTEFFQSETFQLEYIEGYEGSFKHGLSAVLGGETSLPEAFHNMATSMMDYIRSGPNTKLARGTRVDTEIFVLVRWYWLIGPGLIELASLLFAVATIVSNDRKHKVPLWKSSALVLLACSHDEDEGLITGTTESVVEIEKKARDSKVRLE
ncbi:hypothetical protein NW768_010708 [Fusarium equiseti]|uniref:Uncharacterized protein n=1 Tax=Fusarium equiseti TaxID=61235 RepID=A0ABQ8QZW9_FUSEQ|nr:hypothetical protein NW768_010708 [Fusarium equiseti]